MTLDEPSVETEKLDKWWLPTREALETAQRKAQAFVLSLRDHSRKHGGLLGADELLQLCREYTEMAEADKRAWALFAGVMVGRHPFDVDVKLGTLASNTEKAVLTAHQQWGPTTARMVMSLSREDPKAFASLTHTLAREGDDSAGEGSTE